MGRGTQPSRTFIQRSRQSKYVTSHPPKLRVLGLLLMNQMSRITAGMVPEVLLRVGSLYYLGVGLGQPSAMLAAICSSLALRLFWGFISREAP